VRCDQISRVLTERVIAACQMTGSPEIDRLMSLLRRFEAEAAREEARAFTADSAAYRAPPPLLVRFEEFEERAPSSAPLLLSVQDVLAPDTAPPPVELPLDLLAALAEAA
jgi:hypothetical protein